MGITLRAEASGKLTNIPFLSKNARVPTDHDNKVFLRAGLTGPKAPMFAIIHDKARLVGKLTAKVKSMDIKYRVTRMLSYLHLTAHHPDIHAQLYKIITTTKSFQPTLNAMKVRVPTYEEVIREWYDPDTIVTQDPDDVLDENETVGNIVVYGNVTTLDSIMSVCASIPDLVNPSLFNFGYMRSLQARLSHLCSWPMTLLSLQNSLVSQSELGVFVSKTCYDFLDPMLCVNPERDVNITTLLFRHWAFCAYLSLTGSRRSKGIVTSLSRKISSAAFILNGKVHMEGRNFDFRVVDLLVVCAINLIRAPAVLDWVSLVEVPNISSVVERFYNLFLFKFWSSLPPNYNDLNVFLRKYRTPSAEKGLVVSAPTGTGKSTALINHLSIVLGHKYNKIIVVEPRSAIVKSLVPYMVSTFALDCSGATSGLVLDSKAKVWYVTAQELLLHASWLDPDNIIVIDEAHVDEPAYKVAIAEISTSGVDHMFVTATPTLAMSETSMVVSLNTANVWKKTIRNFKFVEPESVGAFRNHYFREALSTVDSIPSSSKALVFFNTIRECTRFASSCSKTVQVLSSNTKSTGLIVDAQVIASTSVADVGLTLPNVDLVITSDIGIDVGNTLKGVSIRNTRLDSNAITQRCGRTGRTNHGCAHVLSYPCVPVFTPHAEVVAEEELLSLISSGIPIKLIAKHNLPILRKLMGIENAEDTVKDAALNEALTQLDLYRDNLDPLLKRRMELMELETSDHLSALPVDAARLGLLRLSTNDDVNSLISSLFKVAVSLGHRSVASGKRLKRLETVIRKHSAALLGNIRSRMPFPDPDLGEWGMQIEEDIW
uniref:RNA-dependent RNA polymerase n=1 Tax=Grapevine-associated fusarivirus 1 TaxID=2814409 RepID=A0A8F5MJZ7_9VIRU|nr:MAG: RNA-dependent RNA polymerase [Grapevine-associated fusarivirus 1]